MASSIGVNACATGHVTRKVLPGGPGHTVFRVGEVHGRLTPRVEQLAEMLSSIDSARATSNLWSERWARLVINSMGNGVSAINGLGGKDMTLTPAIRQLSIQPAGKGGAVGKAHDFNLESVRGVEADVMPAAVFGDQQALEQVVTSMLRGVAWMMDEGRPLAGRDIVKGRRAEIDFLSGLVADKGDEVGIPTPTHRALVEVVKMVSRGETTPEPGLVRRVWELSGISPRQITVVAR